MMKKLFLLLACIVTIAASCSTPTFISKDRMLESYEYSDSGYAIVDDYEVLYLGRTSVSAFYNSNMILSSFENKKTIGIGFKIDDRMYEVERRGNKFYVYPECDSSRMFILPIREVKKFNRLHE